MFAEHGGAKEQWYIALSRLDHDGDSVQLLQDMYGRYSALCHQKQFATFPFSGALKSQGGSSNSSLRVNKPPRRNWMRKLWGQGRNGQQKTEPEVKLQSRHLSEDSQDASNPFTEMERMWMTEGWTAKIDSQDTANPRRKDWRKTRQITPRKNTPAGTPILFARDSWTPQTPKKDNDIGEKRCALVP